MSNSPFENKTLKNDMVYKTLLESTLAIPWSIDWASKKFSYIGPQIEKVLGWKQDSWVSVEDWANRMHESDRDYVVSFCVTQSIAGIDHEADYRAQMADGSYKWIRDVVHVVRHENGEVESLVGFMFDITEHKRQEEKLQELQRQLEEYSYKDGLTKIANRRLFEDFYQREWQSAIRQNTALSIILLDIDFFKQYNDCYGHMVGDVCLQQLAQLLEGCIHRPRDLVARFGGEEFVLVLPETTLDGATIMAEKIIQTLAEAKIPHAASPIAAHVTASLGVKTIVPQQQDDAIEFLKEIDQHLYQAKQKGRNRYLAA